MQRKAAFKRLVALAFASTGLLAISPVAADEVQPAPVKRLSADEIRSQIPGHEFRGYYRTEDGALLQLNAYFTTGGKYFDYVTEQDKPNDLTIKSFEVQDDRLCWHDLGVMKPERLDRCFGVYVFPAEKSWSGYLEDEKDPKARLPLEMAFGTDSAEIEVRWMNWDSIRQETGPIDSFGSLDELTPNPFRFRGKLQIMRGRFVQMIGDGRGWFATIGQEGGQDDGFIADGIPNEMFQKAGQEALIVGEFTGNEAMTLRGDERFIPLMTAKATRLCKAEHCEDYIKPWF